MKKCFLKRYHEEITDKKMSKVQFNFSRKNQTLGQGIKSCSPDT